MKSKRLFVRWLMNGILMLGVTACAPVQQQIKPESEFNTVQDISVTDQLDKSEIAIVADKPLIYTSYELTDPQRLIVDLTGASVGKFKDVIPVHQGAVVEIHPIEGTDPNRVARLEITLSQSVPAAVRAEGSKLLISIDKPTGTIPTEQAAGTVPPSGQVTPPPTEAAQQAPIPTGPEAEKALIEEKPSLPPAKTVSKLTLEPNQDKVNILITADGMLKPEAFTVEGNRLVVDLPDVTSSIRPNTISVKHKLLKRVRIGQHVKPKKVRVVFDLAAKVSFTVEPSGKGIAVTLVAAAPTPAPAPTVSEAMPAEVPPEKPTRVEAAPEKPVAPEKVQPPPVVAPVLPAAVPEEGKKGEVQPQKKYVGRKISLDFQDAEISNVLRLLADVSGLNIVISEDVKGKVTLKLINVPWDQALNIVLKMNNLGQVREGNIIRVATIANITKQQDDEAHAKEAKIKAEDLITKVIYVNYAKAEDLAASLKKNLSPRGDITIDTRTNTIIVKDIEKDVNEVAALVKTLDARTPQVQIESRIVQADTSFAQSLGIQWGAGFTYTKSNNVLGFQGINTAPGVTQPGFGTFTPNFAVNMPANVAGLNAVPSVGFNFGRFSGNPINLDLRLSAGELNGLTKTISSPKVTTLDNVKAKIEQGESIPFQTSSANTGPTTTFIDANLTLEVTPHVTPDRSIIMKVRATRNSLGSFSGPAGPSIAKREATTEVLVRDGETTVIGGILVDERKNTETGVPLLSRIPILGWLFKNEARTDTKNELLIFLTPKIVKD